MVAVLLICQLQILHLIWPQSELKEVIASGNATISLTVRVYKPSVAPPQDFTVTYISPNQVNIDWIKPASANNTLIRAVYYDAIANREVGYQVYYGSGNSVSDTALNLDITFGPVIYRAWSENTTGVWSAVYAEGSTESPFVEDVASNLGTMGTFVGGILYFIPIALISLLAFWKENHVLFMALSGIAMMTGLYTPDIICGDYITTPLSYTIGLGMIAYSILCVAWALRLMFWRPA